MVFHSLDRGIPHAPWTSRTRQLEQIAQEMRLEILEILSGIGDDHRGHPGSSLSIVDIVTALYFQVLRVDPANPAWEDRDRFVLSKGHGCLAVYVALAKRGFFEPEHLPTFRSVDSILQGHPDMTRTPGIDMTSGSLGNGLSAAVGIALAKMHMDKKQVNVFAIVGDGELQEGLIWEAAMAACKYRLHNLIVFVDCNRLQSSGSIDAIMPVEPLSQKWRAFGWDVLEIDGHDMTQILKAVERARLAHRKPTAILAHTIKGKGVPYMENNNLWHQRCPEEVNSNSRRNRTRTVNGRKENNLASTRTAYGETLLELAREGKDIAVISADAFASMSSDILAKEFPERCFEVGIAEQNLMMVAAGMATTGKTVFASTYSMFSSMRACEQIRTFIAYPGLNVKIIGGLGGFSGGIEGATHVALEDIGIMRCIPNLVILNPADAVTTRGAVRAAADYKGPVYIRLGRDPSPIVFGGDHSFTIGKGQVLLEDGFEVVVMTSGLIVPEVLEAAAALEKARLACTVIEFHTLKPLDRKLVNWAASKAKELFVVEEHSVIGGLGSAVMEIVGENRSVPVHRIGVPDCFVESGTPVELRRKYGLAAAQIVERIMAVLKA